MMRITHIPVGLAAIVVAGFLWAGTARSVTLVPSGRNAVPAHGSILDKFPKITGSGAENAGGSIMVPFSTGPGDLPAPGTLVPEQPTPSVPSSPRIIGQGANVQRATGEITQPSVAGAPAVAAPTTAELDPTLLVMGVVYNGGNGSSDNEICSGTLVDSKHVLTAGHCGCGNPASYRVYWLDNVYPPGKTEIGQAGLGPNYYQSQAPVMFDPQLCTTGVFKGNDLALLELAGNASLPAPTMNYGDPLWTQLRELHIGERMLVVGYGYNNQNLIGFRNKDSIPIMSVACTERSLAPYCTAYDEMLLGETTGGAQRDDTCGGDSGGPVFHVTDTGYTLLAVTSRSAPGVQNNPGKNCGGGGIYTILSRDSVQQWLKANGVQPAPWVNTADTASSSGP
jgi:hypothetical protein